MKKLLYSLIFFTINTPLFASEGSTELLNYWYMVLPFVALLLMIATGPLFYHHFWEKHYPKIAIAMGVITVTFYIVVLHDTVSLMHTLAEYLSFIALLASLFVASGGILIKVDKKATPMLNVLILIFGSIIANVIGTTGASMLLIRPFIKINKDRIKPYHIVFFIFSVSNIGGALTPIGDPPLFLGFLRGVEFFWVIQHVWYIWAPTLIVLMSIFYVLDSMNKSGNDAEKDYSGKIEFKGLKNIGFLAIIIISVFIDPNVQSWVPSLAPLPFGIRELIMFSIVYLSYKYADKEALRANEFDFEPIREVAYLFAGLFATMIPALQLIAIEAHEYGEELNAGLFYWSTGSLSAFLDNAPTYLNFLSAEMGKFGMDVTNKTAVHEFQMLHPLYLSAISVGAVFFGAMSYIGNAPNFMVKSISERAGINMPSFFGYMIKYSIPILIPIFVIVWYVFYYGQG
ncbi:MAG: sodium:proton antiporter [Melioribacteraceae bacterium]|nr:sodium:proton antiporter [Melioribacteraceae bacterium]MCF8353957.1 sodium:proton antiporter [Melioribacteraceae bacterium]MCF8393685.1 sodium:proton antiporter [Melioribacteraceae bacterium]MCF8419573.1 sodium:proton antiporter [Melioribacteraceae bacterium]